MVWYLLVIHFGERLQKAREEKGLSQDKLGEMIGKGRLQVMRWENGRAEPKFQDLERLGKALDKTVAWFFFTKDEEDGPSLSNLTVLQNVLCDASQMLAKWMPESGGKFGKISE